MTKAFWTKQGTVAWHIAVRFAIFLQRAAQKLVPALCRLHINRFEKNHGLSQLYQIHCLTSRTTAAILRIYYKHALFYCLSHSWQAVTCANRIWADLASLRKHPFLLALRRRGRFAQRNVWDSATEIPYWWRKICPESGQKRWLVNRVVTLF